METTAVLEAEVINAVEELGATLRDVVTRIHVQVLYLSIYLCITVSDIYFLFFFSIYLFSTLYLSISFSLFSI